MIKVEESSLKELALAQAWQEWSEVVDVFATTNSTPGLTNDDLAALAAKYIQHDLDFKKKIAAMKVSRQ